LGGANEVDGMDHVPTGDELLNFCRFCGSGIPKDSTFCKSCETKLEPATSNIALHSFINIENVVSTVSLRHGVKIDLAIKAFPSPDYKPGVHVSKVVFESSEVLRFLTDQPKLAILVFESGKILCTGPKSVAVAYDCLRGILNDIWIRGIKTPNDPQFQVQNIVASAGLGGNVDLEMCVKKLKRIQYEPNQFPGVIYRMDDPKVVALIFRSGKLVLTGAKSENEVHRSVANLEVILRDKKLITYPRTD
jgi:transcription initiation factor TFIID TATA-box-binding protein